MTFEEQKYDQLKNIPRYWYNHSCDLRASAAALEFSKVEEVSDHIVKEFQLGGGFAMSAAVGPVYRMLWGMSFELLFKAVATAQKKEFPKTHKLVDLASVAGVLCSKQETGTLEFLTECIIWDGRYPVPLESKKGGKDQAVETMQKLNDLYSKHFMQPANGNNTWIKKSNGKLRWKELNVLWKKAEAEYWKIER